MINSLYFLIFSCLLYLGWALIYHKKDKTLTFAIWSEYLLIALLSIILLMGVLF